ncbi:hypothetical protein B0J14DRAFT_567132 [Halenospora varia]|nr:hypothetical protein B0J14DRAFT_567132 [Halenospora varia]
MTKLSPVRKEGREAAGGTRSTSSTKPSRYRCIACGRSRSSTYHSRHPPEEPPPPQGICRRCIDKEEQEEHFPPPPEITIYEFHYYHHTCTCQHGQPFASTAVELPLSPAYPACAELPAEDFKDRSLSPHQLIERVPPPVAFWRKPSYQSL